jgi:hypothetical protein
MLLSVSKGKVLARLLRRMGAVRLAIAEARESFLRKVQHRDDDFICPFTAHWLSRNGTTTGQIPSRIFSGGITLRLIRAFDGLVRNPLR